MQWYNEPLQWHEDNDVIHITAGAKTDFWRQTHYGFIRDNGNFYYRQVSGDFTAEVKITGCYRSLYDSMMRLAYLTESPIVQVGLMCVAPQGEGFAVEFEGFKHSKPI